MLGRHVAVVALTLVGCAALAQEPARATLTVVVTDQTGAVIPGAHVELTNEATGVRFEATTVASGEVAVPVDEGIYDLNVGAPGFAFSIEKRSGVQGAARRNAILRIASGNCTACLEVGPFVPLEHQPLTSQIPSIPAEPLALPSRPIRQRIRWF